MTDPNLTADAADVLAELADISSRMRRFEPVSDDELAAFKARKESVIERIDPGHYGS